MKKFTSLMMLFCLSIGMALAQLPVVSQAPSNGKWAEGTKWYTIKRNNTNPIALSNADANGYLKLNGTSTKLIDGCWCVVGDETNGYQFYNLQAGTTQTLGAYGSNENGRMKMYDLDVTTDGSNTLTKTFDIKTLEGQTGYAFVKNHGSTNAWWNERSGYLAYWNNNAAYATNCTGSQYTFEEVDVTAFVDDYKTKAKAALDMVSFLSVDDEKAAIDAVEKNVNAFAAIDAIVNSVAQHIAIRNGDTDPNQVRYNAYLAAHMPDSKGHGTKPFDWKNATWSLKYSGDGSFYIYNVNNEVYLGDPNSRGALTVTPIAAYTFAKYGETANNLFELKCGNQTLHLQNTNGDGTVSAGWALMNYSPDVASSWYIETDFAAHVETYKNAALTALDSWKNLSVVFDGAPIDAVKTAVNGITTTNYATFAAIAAELKKVTDVVAAKMFTFQCTDTSDPARVNVYVAANASTGRAVGADNQDYNAIWSLKYGGGTSFYLYNELNKVYLGAPVNNSDAVVLTETPVAAYTFELIENNVVEMKCNGGTLHASNHDDDKLISYDGDQAASRWNVATIDISGDIQAILDDLTSEDYAEIPALGQYPTSAYNALYEAKNTAKTVAEVNAAIDAFKKAKNLPVFTIDGAGTEYAKGKSIYDDGVDAPNFKETNKLDKTMWWALDQTETAVGVTESVGIYNVGTGNGFWGASSIKVTETKEGEDDDVFLFYVLGVGKDNTMHAQETDQVIVNYNATEKTSGSAWKFTYIGNSYDLADVAKVGSDYYMDIQDAINAAAAGSTVTMLKDINVENAVQVAKTLTIDMNGKTLISAGDGFEVTSGTLTITGNGTVKAGTEGGSWVAVWANEGNAIIENGTYSVVAGTEGSTNDCIYAKGGQITINGGTFSNAGEYVASMGGVVINANNTVDNSKVVINGGTFNPAEGCVAYEVKDVEVSRVEVNNAVVNESELRIVVAAGKNVKLGADIQISGIIEVNKSITIDGNNYALTATDCEFPIAVSQSAEVNVVNCNLTYTREFAAVDTWYALYVPFEITVDADFLAKYDVAQFSAMTTESMTIIMMKEGALAANTPYFIRVKDEASKTLKITVDGAEFKASSTDLSDVATLNGVYTETVASSISGAYALSGGVFRPALDNNQVLKPFRFYLMFNESSQHSRIITISVEGEDGATSIDSELMSPVNGVIYDLQGRRVENPTKGLYIVNGKKVMIK